MINRREFVKTSTLGAIGMSWMPGSFFNQLNASVKNLNYTAIAPRLTVHTDGSFSISAGKMILQNCYPKFDMQSIKPLSVSVSEEKNTILYTFDSGKRFEISFKVNDKELVLSAKTIGFDELPGFIYPLGEAEVVEAQRFFKQGMGFAGPSGLFRFPESESKLEQAVLKEQVWSYDSYLMSGFLFEDTALSVYVKDHRTFLYRSKCYNKHNRFGLIDRHLHTENIFFNTGFQTEKKPVNDREFILPEIHFASSTDAFALFADAARKIAVYNEVKLQHEPRYYYCSWYDKKHEFTQNDLDELLDGLKDIQPRLPLQSIQIDDGYALLGQWLIHTDRFPNGIQYAFDQIKYTGYQPGIWVGPFMVSSDSFVYKDHKDWLLRDKNGEIIKEWDSFHSGGSVHVLDTSHPEAFEYIREVFTTLRKWGATTFKTDFMDWGLRDSTKVTRHTPGKTSVEYFVDVLRMIRESIGEDSYWLACISPYAPFIGFADGMRVSNDVSANWAKETTINMFREMFHGQYFNNVFWQNDPDVCYMRDYNSELSQNEKIAIAYYDGIMGGTITTSDKFNRLSDDQLKLFRFLYPGKNKQNAVLPKWVNDQNVLTVVREYNKGNSWGVLMVNISDQVQETTFNISENIGTSDFHVYEWGHRGSKYMGAQNMLERKMSPRTAKLYYISKDKNPPSDNLAISGVHY